MLVKNIDETYFQSYDQHNMDDKYVHESDQHILCENMFKISVKHGGEHIFNNFVNNVGHKYVQEVGQTYTSAKYVQ